MKLQNASLYLNCTKVTIIYLLDIDFVACNADFLKPVANHIPLCTIAWIQNDCLNHIYCQKDETDANEMICLMWIIKRQLKFCDGYSPGCVCVCRGVGACVAGSGRVSVCATGRLKIATHLHYLVIRVKLVLASASAWLNHLLFRLRIINAHVWPIENLRHVHLITFPNCDAYTYFGIDRMSRPCCAVPRGWSLCFTLQPDKIIFRKSIDIAIIRVGH